MAVADWVEIYQSYTTEELLTLRTTLKKQSETSFIAQGQGSKSHQQSLSEIRDKLQACSRVLESRGAISGGSSADEGWVGVADFSQLRV